MIISIIKTLSRPNAGTKLVANQTPSGEKNKAKYIFSVVMDIIKKIDKPATTSTNIRCIFGNALKESLQIIKNRDLTAVFGTQFFPEVKTPFLPPLSPTEGRQEYTLVLDLDETLVHYIEVFQFNTKILIR